MLVSTATHNMEAPMGYNITAETPRRELSFKGIPIKVPSPFKEGDTLDAAMANTLNQTFGENLRNNVMGKVNKARDENENAYGTPEELQALLDEYATNYVFSGAVGGSRSTVDPVERQARKIMRPHVVAALKEAGHLIKDVEEDRIEDLITAALEMNPHIVDQAKEQIERERELAKTITVKV